MQTSYSTSSVDLTLLARMMNAQADMMDSEGDRVSAQELCARAQKLKTLAACARVMRRAAPSTLN